MKSKQGGLRVARGWLVTPLVTTLILAVVFGLPGCSDKPLNVEPTQDEIGFFDLPFDDEAIAKRSVSYEAVYKCFQELSAEEGGTIEVPGSNGAFSFVVAPNSFPADTVIEIEIYIIDDDEISPTVIYEFKPDGLVFSEPAKLVVNTKVVAGLNSESVGFYYLMGNRWVYQGTFFSTDGVDEIIIEVPHFSKWGTEGGGGR